MAKSLKTKGVQELEVVRRRAHRQLSLDRISQPSYEFLIKALDQVKEVIESIEEKDEDE